MNVVVLVIAGAVAVATDASQYILCSLFCTAFCHYLNFLVVIMLCCVRFFQTGRAFALLCGSAQWFIRQNLKILRKIINIGHVPNSKKRWVKIYRLTSKRRQKKWRDSPNEQKSTTRITRVKWMLLLTLFQLWNICASKEWKKVEKLTVSRRFDRKTSINSGFALLTHPFVCPFVRSFLFFKLYIEIYIGITFFEFKIRQSIK